MQQSDATQLRKYIIWKHTVRSHISKWCRYCCVGIFKTQSSTSMTFFRLPLSCSQLIYVSHSLSDRNSKPAALTARSNKLQAHNTNKQLKCNKGKVNENGFILRWPCWHKPLQKYAVRHSQNDYLATAPIAKQQQQQTCWPSSFRQSISQLLRAIFSSKNIGPCVLQSHIVHLFLSSPCQHASMLPTAHIH